MLRKYHTTALNPRCIRASFVVQSVPQPIDVAKTLRKAMGLIGAETQSYNQLLPLHKGAIVHKLGGVVYVQPRLEVGKTVVQAQAWFPTPGHFKPSMQIDWRVGGSQESLQDTMHLLLDSLTKESDLVVPVSNRFDLYNGYFMP